MKITFIAAFLLMISTCTTVGAQTAGERIYVNSNNEFAVNGKRIWMNGVNTPWNSWNDFGGSYNSQWWDNEFARLRKAGINSARIWINCNNDNHAITIDANGNVSGASEKHWADVASLLDLAKKNKIYVMAAITSFDHFKSSQASRWRAMLTSKSASQSFVDNYMIPFLNKFKDNPYLWCIDLMNEPDWVYENSECGNIPWNNISYFFAINAAAIHENSQVLVTVGLAYPKWNADGGSYQGNKVSDTYLKSLYDNSKAYLDFWSPHYYDWVGEWYGVPHYLSPYGKLGGNKTSGWTGGWGLDSSKPALLGECSARGTGKNLYGLKDNSIITDYEQAFLNGWQGVMAWTSNAVDDNGGLAPTGNPSRDTDLGLATMNMFTNYPQLIFPTDITTDIRKLQSANPLRAWVRNGNLHAAGLTPGKTLSVYDAAGTLVFQSVFTSEDADIPLRAQEMYIIHQDDRTIKVLFGK